MRHPPRFLLLVALLAGASCASAPKAPTGPAPGTPLSINPSASGTRPNVIVIVADDMGYNDMGAYGGRIPTPNLDSLAAGGVRMTNGYATAAVCAPSRAGLLVGRAQTRFGFEFNPVGRDEGLGVALGETTVAQTMKSAGYRTGAVGKWHIGQSAGYHPMDRGFDSYFGVLGGATPYLRELAPGDVHVVTAEDARITRRRLPLYEGRTPVDPDGYTTDLFTNRAIDFIGKGGQQPFFLYLAYTAPHTPLQAPARYMQRVPAGGSEFDRVYYGMMTALDDGVGRLVNHLKTTGQFSNTLIFFVSDNGCPSYVNGACSNQPLNAWKGYPWDGGIRVPYLVSWPQRLRPAVRGDVVSTLDIARTAAVVAGTTHRGAEGVDLLELLGKPERPSERALFWRLGPTHIVRQGRWKLVVVNKAVAPSGPAGDSDDLSRSLRPEGAPAEVSPLGQSILLYDVLADPGERIDLAARHPEIVTQLTRAWTIWDAGNVPAQWTSRRGVNAVVNGFRVELFN